MKSLGIIFVCILIAIPLSALGAWIFMLLWNGIAPIFWASAPVLTFLQAWGACCLLSMLASPFRSIKTGNSSKY